MKSILFILFLLLNIVYTNAQQENKDNLRAIINRHNEDTAEVNAIAYLSRQLPLDSAIQYAQQGLSLARKLNYRKGEAQCFLDFEKIYSEQGNFSRAIQYALDALAIYEDTKDYVGITSAHAALQGDYRETGDYRKALYHAFLGQQTAEAHNVYGSFIFSGHRWSPLLLAEIGQTYILMNQPDSALFYTQKSIAQKELFNGAEWAFPVYLLATILNTQGKYKPALEKYREALVLTIQNNILRDTLQIYSGMSTLFKNMGQRDSAIYYGSIVAQGWNPQSEYKNLLEAVNNLAQVYKAKGNKDSALKYTELSYAIKDSIFSAAKDREVQGITFNAKLKEEELKTTQVNYKSKIQLYLSVAGLLILVLISTILWHNNRQKQKAKVKIEQAYAELKATQAQLVQREKLASLGELTAGIAHEIQNPLNFVNNFSEISRELAEEIVKEMRDGNPQEAMALFKDVVQNLDKVVQHGKRADAIVKNMLQHSRLSTGEKQATDLNALVEEYLRFSFHGMRTKDKDFTAALQTNLDTAIGKVNIVPQDIGRVLLNVFNNALYTVNEKKKAAGDGYEPIIIVSTKALKNKVTIHIKDNGMGIPEKVREKIFQPFFTTKPAGEGTGLGLSLSYDIVTKGHGGKMDVKTKEGEYAEFMIELPV